MDIRRILVLVFFCSTALSADFINLCLSKKRPAGFDSLIRNNFSGAIKDLRFQNEMSCRALAKAVKEAHSVIVFEPLSDLGLIQIFPALSSFELRSNTTVTQLNIGQHPELLSLMVNGPVALSNLGDILNSRLLNDLGILGREGSSFDAKSLTELPKLRFVYFDHLTLKNAKSLESLSELRSLTLKKVTLDQPLDWSSFPHLEKKVVE